MVRSDASASSTAATIIHRSVEKVIRPPLHNHGVRGDDVNADVIEAFIWRGALALAERLWSAQSQLR